MVRLVATRHFDGLSILFSDVLFSVVLSILFSDVLFSDVMFSDVMFSVVLSILFSDVLFSEIEGFPLLCVVSIEASQS